MSLTHSPVSIASANLPTDRPVNSAELRRLGLKPSEISKLVRSGAFRRVFRSVYAPADLPDTIENRAWILRCAVPGDAIFTGISAAWVYGVDLFDRSPYGSAPTPPCSRVAGARRQAEFPDADLRWIGKTLLTTPLRTACDLGRQLPDVEGLYALDRMLQLGEFTAAELVSAGGRLARASGVSQLRELASLADRRGRDKAESALRWFWHQAGLPSPELHIPLADDSGSARHSLTIGAPAVRYAAEIHDERDDRDSDHDEDDLDPLYDQRAGLVWKLTGGPQQSLQESRESVREQALRAAVLEDGWTIDVFRRDQLHRWDSSAVGRLKDGYSRARNRSYGGLRVTDPDQLWQDYRGQPGDYWHR